MSIFLGRLSQSITSLRYALTQMTSTSAAASSSSSSVLAMSSAALLHTSAIQSSWGGGKLKTHTGTAKRFKPTGKRRSKRRASLIMFGGEGEAPLEVEYSHDKVIGVGYKRGRSGKQHLNSKMHHGQEARLRSTKVHTSGHTIRTLNRLLGSHY
jgi:ribosomal protein L35